MPRCPSCGRPMTADKIFCPECQCLLGVDDSQVAGLVKKLPPPKVVGVFSFNGMDPMTLPLVCDSILQTGRLMSF